MTDDPTKLLSMCGICHWPSSVCKCRCDSVTGTSSGSRGIVGDKELCWPAGATDGQRWHCPETSTWIQWSATRNRWIVTDSEQQSPNPPGTIKIGHMNFALKFVPAIEMPTEKAVYGCTDCARLTIFAQQDIPKLLQVDVVLHECLHAIYFAYGFSKKLKEERGCLVLTGPLVALMRDNPQLVQWIQSL